ncbi:olfactory receptor 5AP2-like [Ambystoma mexicanum]|uniref:olfactory receptor 5AP2-like n=1 Tax=Ambystoma mexicanum TaxID=8296 RepID=UPI0037E7024B
MQKGNQTVVREFILLGLSGDPHLQLPLFTTFLLFYLTTLLGNIGIIILTTVDSRLHTPMYFFLKNLSFLDLFYSTAITPKMLINLLSERKAISFIGCALQMYFFGSSAMVECLLLVVMAYDRYVAICNPLLYNIVMNKSKCMRFVAATYIIGFGSAMVHTSIIFSLSYCSSNVIKHFYCDVPPLLQISCSDTNLAGILVLVFGGLAEMSFFLVILTSYISIISSILKIRSTTGRSRAFSTCASHLTAVCLFYGTIIFIYLRPPSANYNEQDRVASVFYTVINPMLNPLIYSLRNNDVKGALRKVLRRRQRPSPLHNNPNQCIVQNKLRP